MARRKAWPCSRDPGRLEWLAILCLLGLLPPIASAQDAPPSAPTNLASPDARPARAMPRAAAAGQRAPAPKQTAAPRQAAAPNGQPPAATRQGDSAQAPSAAIRQVQGTQPVAGAPGQAPAAGGPTPPPNNQPAAPVLTPQEQAELDHILAAWEQRKRQGEDPDLEHFTMWEYDAVFGAPAVKGQPPEAEARLRRRDPFRSARQGLVPDDQGGRRTLDVRW